MKILHVETGRRFFGGAQQVIWLVSGLAARGIDNLLVCPPGSAIDRAARRAGIPVTNVPCSGEIDLRFAWRLRRLARRERPDVVHCHSRRGADFPGGYALLGTGIPAVLSRRVDSRDPSWLSRLRYRPFRKIVAISEHIAAVLGTTEVPGDKLVVIRSAVDTTPRARPPNCRAIRREFDIGEDDYVIAMVAQFIHRKGHRFLFDIIPNLRDSYPHLRVILFGSGPDERKLRELAAKLNLYDTIRFAGFRDDLDDFLACFDLLVHPAVREGLGVAMLKASAAGLPVLAFDTAGAREAVVHGKTGVLVPPGDVAALQVSVALLIQEPAMAADFGAAGRRRMQDEFAIGKMVERHVEMYEALAHD